MIFLQRLLIVLALTTGSLAAELPRHFRVHLDGDIRANPARGETVWSGAMTVELDQFTLQVRGCTTLYSGPSLHTKPGGNLKHGQKVRVEHAWISLIALGEVTVSTKTNDGRPQEIEATRVVYLPGKTHLLIDGKPWPTDPDAPQPTQEPPATAPDPPR